MTLKKILTIGIAIVSALNSPINTYANINNNLSGKDKIIKFSKNDNIIANNIDKQENLVNDIQIKWLHENTIFYVGADMAIEALVNQEATIKDIMWILNELDGKSNIIDLEQIGNKAILKATNPGRAEVMARATDNSDVTRQITVNVENYPNDEFNQALVSDNIVPIQDVYINGINRVLQVEANRSIYWSSKVNAIDTYLKKLSLTGKLSNGNINSEHEYYEFYTINIEGIDKIQIEVRVDKHDESYNDIKEKLTNLEQYDPGSPEPPIVPKPPVDPELPEPPIVPEPPVDPELPEPPIVPKPPVDPELPEPPIVPETPDLIVSKEEVTQGLDDMIILGGYGTQYNPIKLEVNKILDSKEKILIMHKYLNLIQQDKYLQIVSISETDEYSAYKIKVTNKIVRRLLKDSIKNDFYIEIIVDKGDTKSYEPIICMLNQLNRHAQHESRDENLEIAENQETDLVKTQNQSKEEKELDNKKHNSTTNKYVDTNNKHSNIDKVESNNIETNKMNNIQKPETAILSEKHIDNELISEMKYNEKELNNKVILTTVAGASIGAITLGSIDKVNNIRLIEFFRRRK